MVNNQKIETVTVPQKLFSSMVEAQRKWEEFSNELEDFLFASDEQFIKKMEKAREEHREGKLRDFQELKQELK